MCRLLAWLEIVASGVTGRAGGQVPNTGQLPLCAHMHTHAHILRLDVPKG